VIIEVLDGAIAWRSSTPRPGFAVSVEKTGPDQIVVEFESTDPDQDHTSTFEAEWKDGRLEWEIEEDDD
jgi:hypothetical protein